MKRMLRIVSISDTHARHRSMKAIPMGDILIHAGDFTDIGQLHQITDFVDWFASQPHPTKILIAGNHDITLHEDYYQAIGKQRFHRRKEENWAECIRTVSTHPDIIYLRDSGYQYQTGETTINIWGSPWQPEFCDWAFNLDRGEPCRAVWRSIPESTDVLITHGPPQGHGDRCEDGFRAGCADLLDEMKTRIHPKLHIFGHIHEGYGVTQDNDTVYVNASTCTFHYKPTNDPIVVDYCLDNSAKPTVISL